MSEETVTRAAVVTGGSRGIGRAVCVALAKQGCNVVVNYCHGAEPAEQTAALCRAEGVDAVAVQADVSTAEGCKTLFDAAVNAFGRVDVLVNNAGITRDGLLLRMSEADFDAVLNANLKGAFLCCKEAARRMVRQRHGRIINLSSVVALRGNAGQANYAASKAGLIGLTKSLAKELAGRNITVNAVAPGLIETDMTAAMTDAAKTARALAAYAPERMLWGTDFPHVTEKVKPDEWSLLETIDAWFDTDHAKRLALVENPEQVYGFSAD